MNSYQRLVLSLLCCILRRLIEGDKPFRRKYEAMVLVQADAEIEKATP